MIIRALQARVAPARPFLIHYDQQGNRIELSATTFANWVAKTVNFIDTLGVEADEPISIELTSSAPGHWVTAVWVAAAWQAGCPVLPEPDPAAALLVGGPGVTPHGLTVACSLDPLGRGFTELPAGVVDFADVLSEPDACLRMEDHPDLAAWPGRTLAEVTALPGRERTVVISQPGPGWESVHEVLVAPLNGGGASVVVDDSSADLSRIAEQERAELA